MLKKYFIMKESPQNYIEKFFKYFEEETKIQNVYCYFELEIVDRKYKKIYIVPDTSKYDIIKASLYLLFPQSENVKLVQNEYSQHLKSCIENMNDCIAKNFAEKMIKCKIVPDKEIS